MKRVYKTWIDGNERLIIADSKKAIRDTYKVTNVDFWCNISNKYKSILRNVICINSKN